MQVTRPLFFNQPHKDQLGFIHQAVFTVQHIGYAKARHNTKVFCETQSLPEAFEVRQKSVPGE
jgi:hypothetical protein